MTCKKIRTFFLNFIDFRDNCKLAVYVWNFTKDIGLNWKMEKKKEKKKKKKPKQKFPLGSLGKKMSLLFWLWL